jgi:hypothetical protein
MNLQKDYFIKRTNGVGRHNLATQVLKDGSESFRPAENTCVILQKRHRLFPLQSVETH